MPNVVGGFEKGQFQGIRLGHRTNLRKQNRTSILYAKRDKTKKRSKTEHALHQRPPQNREPLPTTNILEAKIEAGSRTGWEEEASQIMKARAKEEGEKIFGSRSRRKNLPKSKISVPKRSASEERNPPQLVPRTILQCTTDARESTHLRWTKPDHHEHQAGERSTTTAKTCPNLRSTTYPPDWTTKPPCNAARGYGNRQSSRDRGHNHGRNTVGCKKWRWSFS